MNSSFVYFVMHKEHAEIRVGVTEYSGGRFSRLQQHANYGFSGPFALVPGSEEDEKRTHELLRPFLSTAKSIYKLTPEIAEYFEALLALGRAAPTEAEAPFWPRLDFELWRFRSPALQYIEPDGQMGLFRAAPLRVRIEYAHQQAILQSRGDEWYTPSDLLDRARRVMGSIDLDPASSPLANRTVNARMFYTKQMNGLNGALPWSGRVWLNPPYGRGPDSAGAFVQRLVNEWKAGHIREAITCLNLNAMSSEWFRPLHEAENVHAIVFGRPTFISPHDKAESSPTKGTVLSYLGPNADAFTRAYGDIAAVYRRYEIPDVDAESFAAVLAR